MARTRINLTQIEPGTDGQMVRMIGTVPTWVDMADYAVASGDMVFHQTPSGVVDGSNDTFTLASAAVGETHVAVYLNGMRQFPGAGNDYTITGQTIVFEDPPDANDRIVVEYIAT